MGTWTYDPETGWDGDDTDSREDQARRDWDRMKQEEAEYIRRHQVPELQIIPVEREQERPYVPTPGQIQDIIDTLDRPEPPKPKIPYLN